MNNFRSQRLEKTVYQRRRLILVSEYSNYVTSPSPNTPGFDLLPHVIELSSFPPFRDIIRAPEGTEMGVKPFESAFAQLPVLIAEWRKRLDAELAELIQIPPHLSSKNKNASGGVASSGATRMESSQPSTDKLRLACAVFNTGHFIAWYPEVFSSVPVHADPICGTKEWECAMSLQDRFDVKFLEDAPYIVHACGLDPNVATVDDMDHRNARLKCLYCNKPYIRGWRGAVRPFVDRIERSVRLSMTCRTIVAACALLSSNWAKVTFQVITLGDRQRRVYGCNPDCRVVCQYREGIASDDGAVTVSVMPSLCWRCNLRRRYPASPHSLVSFCVVTCTCR
jgi:hypothetical protein